MTIFGDWETNGVDLKGSYKVKCHVHEVQLVVRVFIFNKYALKFPKNKFRLEAAFIDVTITNYMPAVVLNRRP